jgi:MFS family permease
LTCGQKERLGTIFYAVATAVSGTGSLVFGRLFDRFGFVVLVILTLVSALFAPLVLLGGFWAALIGAAIWGGIQAPANRSEIYRVAGARLLSGEPFR